MASGKRNWLGAGGIAILAVIAVLAVGIAFFGIPMIADASGADERTVTYLIAGLCFIIVAVSVVRARMVKNGVARGSKNE